MPQRRPTTKHQQKHVSARRESRAGTRGGTRNITLGALISQNADRLGDEVTRSLLTRSVGGAGGLDTSVLHWRPVRIDPEPSALAGFAQVTRRGVVRIPNTTTGASSINLTVGDIVSCCGVTNGFYIKRIAAWAYGTTNNVRTAIFDLKAINYGDQNFETSVQDLAPPNRMPAVQFIFPQGQRPSLPVGTSAAAVIMTVTPEQVGYAFFEVHVDSYF
jgi:hypothetical protein